MVAYLSIRDAGDTIEDDNDQNNEPESEEDHVTDNTEHVGAQLGHRSDILVTPRKNLPAQRQVQNQSDAEEGEYGTHVN